MAEDGLIGFKFLERDDNLEKDAGIRAASDLIFSETTFDHLGGKTDPVEGIPGLQDVRDFDGSDALDSFDFTEGFDFIM